MGMVAATGVNFLNCDLSYNVLVEAADPVKKAAVVVGTIAESKGMRCTYTLK